MQFQDELAGGIVLVRPALRSPNYVAGSAGWSIDIDGSAEFSNVVIRGSGVHDAIIVGPSTGAQVVIGSTATLGFVAFPTNSPVEDDVATIVAGRVNPGAVDETLSLQIQGASTTGAGDTVEMQLNSQADDGSSEATWALTSNSGASTIIASDSTLTNINTRLTVEPTVASASSLLFVDGAAGHTGNLLRLLVNATDQFVVDAGGEITTYAANTFSTFTATVNNTGGATWTTETGWYASIGKMHFVTIYLDSSGAGAGANTVTINLPFTPYRGTRQTLTVYGSSGVNRVDGSANIFVGGAGNVIDNLRVTTGTGAVNTLTGVDITANDFFTVQGWLREA